MIQLGTMGIRINTAGDLSPSNSIASKRLSHFKILSQQFSPPSIKIACNGIRMLWVSWNAVGCTERLGLEVLHEEHIVRGGRESNPNTY